jgi:hypothetical protein
MPIKGIARRGDREAWHCSPPRRKGHFRSVFANGIPVSGHGHLNTRHLKPCTCYPCCCYHDESLKATQWAVFAEGIPVGRVGDPTCTRVTQGSPNVFVGGGVSGGRNKLNTFLDIVTVGSNIAGAIPNVPKGAGKALPPRGPGSAV